MNKKLIIIISIVAIIVAGSAGYAYKNKQDTNEEARLATVQSERDKMIKDNTNHSEMSPEEIAKMMNPADPIHSAGSYVTLADYQKDVAKYQNTRRVYFFHASWCPICQGIDKEINADITKIPAGVTLIKADFDSSLELRKKYGVTVQYTFVQIDANEAETAQWSATSLKDVIDGIKQ